MESDLSLLEISEEDDSLLQQIPTSDEMSSVNKYLSCSPLLRSAAPSSRSSPLDCMKVDEHAVKASRSSPSYKFNKENINVNKPEVPNLSNEPQQMKRRKKGGGYNLRKSLAWNRAFFTEEGVLDSSELSMISGAFNKFHGGALSAIQEEGINSTASDSDIISDSADLQSLEEHLFKELPGNMVKKGKVIESCFSPKCASSARNKVSPASVASRKALSAHDVNRSGSKRGGYSRPLASSSDKTSANASTTKAVSKESKIPKIPILKPDSGSLSVSTRTRSATMNNQIARRALNVQKNVAFKGSSNSRRPVDSDIKSGPGSKSFFSKPSVQPLRKDMGNSFRQMPLSSKLQSPQVANSFCGRRLIRDPEVPATALQALTSSAHDISTNYAVPHPQNPELISGAMLSKQLQARKPSSLRMPSPSLGFFGQPKASGSQSSLERGTLPCKIPEFGIPKLQKLGSTIPECKQRPPRAPVKKLKVVDDATSVRSSSTASSVSSVLNSVSQDNMKLNFQKVDEKVPQEQLHSTLDDAVNQYQEHADPSKIEKFSCKGDREMQLGPAVQVLGVSQINLMTEHEKGEDKKCISFTENHDVIAEAEKQSRVDIGDSYQGVHGLNIRSWHGVDEQLEQDELTKSCLGENNQTSCKENQGPWTSDSILLQESRSPEASQINVEDANLNALALAGSELESVSGLPQYRKQADEAAGIDILSIKSHLFDAKSQFVDYNLLVESRSWKISFDVDNQHLKVDGVSECSGEPLEHQNLCLIEQDHNELHKVDGKSEINCSIEQLHREDHEYNASANNYCVLSESQSVDVSQDALIMLNNCGTAMHDIDELCADQSDLKMAHSSATDQILQKENQTMQASNSNLIEENSSFEEYRKHSTGNVADASPQIQGSSGNEFDCSQTSSQLKCTDQANEVAARVYDMTEENRSFEEFRKHCIGNVANASSQIQGSSGSEFDCSQPSSQLKCIDQANEENSSFDEFQKRSTVNVADSSLQIQGSHGSEFDCSQPSSQLKCIDQANEETARMHDMTEKSQSGDANGQCLDCNQFIEDCISNLTNSANHHDYPMAFDDVNKQLGEHSELKNPCSFDDLQKGNTNVHNNDEFVASKCSDASESESKDAAVLSWVPLAMPDGSIVKLDKTRRLPCVKNLLESSIETETSVKDQTYIADIPVSAYEFNSQAVVTAANLKEYYSLGKEIELLIQTSGKAESGCYLNEEARSFENFQKDGKEHIVDANSKSRSGSEPESSLGSSLPKHTKQANECASGVDNMAKNSPVGNKRELVDTNLITESFQYNQNISEVYDLVVVGVDDAKEATGELSKKSSETFCSLIEKSCLSGHNDQPSLDQSISGTKCKSLLEEAETQNSNGSNSDSRNKLDDVFFPAEDKDATMQLLVKKSGNDAKQDVIKPPPNAVPFSDEWLAAMEAAGEDILAMKTGAVQHSPPDKSIAEPSPWSPVRRKNNQGIGPFDCTKYTNTSPSKSH